MTVRMVGVLRTDWRVTTSSVNCTAYGIKLITPVNVSQPFCAEKSRDVHISSHVNLTVQFIRRGSDEKYWRVGNAPYPQIEVASALMRGVSLPQQNRGPESIVSPPQRGPGRARPETHFGVFWCHRTLLFAPICRCCEFVRQCFMLFGEQGRGLVGNCPLPQRRTAPAVYRPVGLSMLQFCQSVTISTSSMRRSNMMHSVVR